ncbi:MAG: YiiX/YebB-like N1pC/P60 family cysteine hydrolase, partial [Candidatus Omnitrophica bacterium]|nr:YiiX/YebB-like N1pC/P60 family cysteine hydrolase [Candidatus Omnitrophota bacterium]
DWSWQEDGYKKMAQSLSDHIANNGFENSMNMYKGSMFESSFVDAIESNGVSVGEYIQNKVDAGAYNVFLGEDGMEYASVDIFNSAGVKVGEVFLGHYDDQNAWDTYNGYGTGSSIQFGNMKIDPFGEVRLDTGEIKVFDEDGQGISTTVYNGNWLEQYVFDTAGEGLFKIEPLKDGETFSYKNIDEYLNVKIIDFVNQQGYVINADSYLDQYWTVAEYDNFLYEDYEWLSEYVDIGMTEEILKDVEFFVINDENGMKVEVDLSNSLPETVKVWGSLGGYFEKRDKFFERLYNYNNYRGFRTEAEIQTHIDLEYQNALQYGETGDIVFVNGKTASAKVIKDVSGGPVHHTGILHVDELGDKYIIEMQTDGGLRMVAIDEFFVNKKIASDDVLIGRISGVNLEKMKDSIKETCFEEGQLRDVPYNFLNLIGLNGQSQGAFICSALVEHIYKGAGVPIFNEEQAQYSPAEIWERINNREDGVIY